MNTCRFTPSSAVLAVLALGSSAFFSTPAAAAVFPIWGQQAPPSYQPGQSRADARVERISPRVESFSLKRFAGTAVRSVRGEDLSTITDFLVGEHDGRVRFAILPSGRGANGMTYRIVPISAFTGATEEGLILRLDRAQWDRVGTMEEYQLQGRVNVDVDHQERLARQLGLPVSEIYDGRGTAELVRATSLRGQGIRSGNGEVGRIEDVVVDVMMQRYAVVVDADQSFAGNRQRYLIPFEQLGTPESGSWRSRLRREDFPPVDVTPVIVDNPRDRDGRFRDNDNNNFPASRDQLAAASNAVTQALNKTWARGRVDVDTTGSRLVLRGLVDTPQQREAVERIAEQNAPGLRIENQVGVRGR